MKPQELSGIRLASALAGRTAHDLNNLLAVFSGHLFLLRNEAESPEEGFAAIEQATEQLQRMTQSLMTLASVGRDAPEPFDLNTLVAEAAAELGAETDLDPTLRPIPGRREDVRVAIDALLANAKEASPPGSPVRVATRELSDGSGASVRIEDSGAGIPANLADRVFEPFFSTRSKGRGIGLTLAAAVAAENGGTCRIEGRPEGGTRILFELPRKAGPTQS